MRRRGTALLVAAPLVWASLAASPLPPASASFTSSPSGQTLTVTSGTLAAPSGLSASCFILTPTRVRLNWTATSSTWASGYEIARGTASGGPYTVVGTVSGQSTTTYEDIRPNTSTYYYVVRATKFAWRSANSNQATTPGICLL